MMQAMIYTCTLVLPAISISLSAILKVNWLTLSEVMVPMKTLITQ